MIQFGLIPYGINVFPCRGGLPQRTVQTQRRSGTQASSCSVTEDKSTWALVPRFSERIPLKLLFWSLGALGTAVLQRAAQNAGEASAADPGAQGQAWETEEGAGGRQDSANAWPQQVDGRVWVPIPSYIHSDSVIRGFYLTGTKGLRWGVFWVCDAKWRLNVSHRRRMYCNNWETGKNIWFMSF